MPSYVFARSLCNVKFNVIGLRWPLWLRRAWHFITVTEHKWSLTKNKLNNPWTVLPTAHTPVRPAPPPPDSTAGQRLSSILPKPSDSQSKLAPKYSKMWNTYLYVFLMCSTFFFTDSQFNQGFSSSEWIRRRLHHRQGLLHPKFRQNLCINPPLSTICCFPSNNLLPQ